MAENLGWEAGERDKKVFKELLSLLGQNRLRDQIDDRGTNWLLPRAKVALTEAEVSEQEKKNIRKMVRNLKAIRRSQPRRVPGLKVLSAIAICNDFKDTEEKSLGQDYYWRENFSGCNGSCVRNAWEPYRWQHPLCWPQPANICGFCRFAKWIRETPLPRELKGYCKNVLDYLGQTHEDWNCITDTDEEAEFYQELYEFDEGSSEDDDEEEEEGEEGSKEEETEN